MTKDPNAIRWGGGAGHYEVWYVTFHLPGRNRAFWFRYTLDVDRSGRAEPALWASCFERGHPARNFSVRETYPAEALRRSEGDLVVGIGPHELRRDGLRGAVSGGGHDVSWDLRFRPAQSPVHLIPPILQPLGSIQGAGVVFPNQDVRLDGTATVDGKKISVKAAPGGQTHLWGKKRKDAWAWGHCNTFEGDEGSFEGLSLALAPGIVVNQLHVRHGSKVFGFNSGLWWALARSRFSVPHWTFTAREGGVRLVGAVRARMEEMVQVTYRDPDGAPLFCCNSETADMDLRLLRPGEAPVLLRAQGTAAVEFTSRKEHPGVRTWI